MVEFPGGSVSEGSGAVTAVVQVDPWPRNFSVFWGQWKKKNQKKKNHLKNKKRTTKPEVLRSGPAQRRRIGCYSCCMYLVSTERKSQPPWSSHRGVVEANLTWNHQLLSLTPSLAQ